MLTVDSKVALELVIVILGALAASIRLVNYALYGAAVAGAVLIARHLPSRARQGKQPSQLAGHGQSPPSLATCARVMNRHR